MSLKSLIPVGRQRGVARADNPFISLQQEIDRLFDDFAGGFPSLGNGMTTMTEPTMDVAETDKSKSPPSCPASRKRTCRSTSPTTF
jgi:HSP20 family protein